MSARDDGGAAFPRPISEDRSNGDLPDGNDIIGEQDGMSLRDYFAAHVVGDLIGLTTKHPYTYGEAAAFHKAVAETAYELADAMLEARKR